MRSNRCHEPGCEAVLSRIAIVVLLLAALAGGGGAQAFDYGPVVASAPQTLFVSIQSVGPGGSVEINGVDTAPVTGEFNWDWGDGAANDGWFPQQHTYADTGRNYVVTVTAFHQDATTQHASAIVFFVPAAVVPASMPPNVSVEIPSLPVVLQSHYVYPPPADLVPLPDSVFTTYSRGAMAQVLRAVAVIPKDLANDDVFLTDGDFAQVALQNASFGGGGTHTIVFAFDQTVTSALAAVVEGAATAGTPTFSGNEVSVSLSNAGAAQYVTVAVSGAHASATGLEGAGSVRIGFLAGDVNGTRNVSLADLLGVNAVLTQLVTGTNFLRDVNVSGSLTLSDLLAVNARLTQVLPAP